ncbi:MAG: hypothetical protein A3E29_04590 [Candidatus Doudnabacteria bacterium RIFCSPHIGHO2_12_FULL_48_16]|uniref:Uncharacterized protein n=1 Tax=Candidatus Doudnabacteria bacterium RIFCSPHIGHO2_12_FULL_48_16 TaxID=1817838 RepID=A0A1F5PKE4_9BACT|nr:MAG: hypothetical protein A3B77_04010 [Candidatus Doudnabacteria bacterium RIFCSPHIGHO2_02_FULL_49_24]OGE90337.1 MAG: hypothetical protein A3E29_04590 [Candidatus Doudnabacteria bacterium RIFCSPHIGHO2_12_FULL_48_16]OGE97044.1 MAG: hypothetical protein A2990_01580 [Candidatus Doudnabacteria bacterium RIFCSPLOWO2_01_FULL_49_40]
MGRREEVLADAIAALNRAAWALNEPWSEQSARRNQDTLAAICRALPYCQGQWSSRLPGHFQAAAEAMKQKLLARLAQPGTLKER